MSATDHEYRIVLTTAGSPEQAESIARALVKRRLAACVNVVPRVRSYFRWEDKLHEEDELLLVIKTEERLFEGVRDAIRETSDYDLPEVIALEIDTGDAEYLSWLSECVAGEASEL